jgi:hypothetical protein
MEGRGLVEDRIGRGCIARSGGIGQGKDTTSIEGRQKILMTGTDGDNPNGHRDVRGSQPA